MIDIISRGIKINCAFMYVLLAEIGICRVHLIKLQVVYKECPIKLKIMFPDPNRLFLFAFSNNSVFGALYRCTGDGEDVSYVRVAHWK